MAPFLFAQNASPTSSLLTESSLLEKRLFQPDVHFLLDGNQSITLDQWFYFNSKSNHSLWKGLEFNPILLHKKRVPDSKVFFISSKVGNEVGDPHLQELIIPNEVRNHTPMLYQFIAYKPFKSLEVWTQFDQNDHFSSSTLALRRLQKNTENPSWFGENIPPSSLIELGFQWENSHTELMGKIESGYLWTTSPLSGIAYPWKGNRYSGTSTLYGIFRINGQFQHWKPLENNSNQKNQWTQLNSSLLWTPSLSGGSWKLSTETGIELNTLELNLKNKLKHKAPFLLPYVLNLTASKTGKNQWKLSGSTQNKIERHYYQTHTSLALNLPWKQGFWEIGNQFYLQKNKTNYSKTTEWLNPTALTTSNLSDFQMGESPYARIQWEQVLFLPLNFGFKSGLTYEQGTPAFQLDSIIMQSSFPLRVGKMYNTHNLWQSYQEAHIQLDLIHDFITRVKIRLRQPLTSQTNKIDYLPSPLFFQIQQKIKTTTNLSLEAIINYVGTKEVRNWSANQQAFKIPSHWEANFTLTQSFRKESIKLYYSTLHLFGDEVQEHPVGNPLRFRVLVGAEASF